ncbi:Transposase [Shigella dysenteriae 1617]|uniref:Transposase n=1 Tax=Shigella dysenteriae 1617 TaxID=754093 RepID=A0A0A7A140_SHIDY|nr:Transposase [Shigella dysenteriae 1617]
MASVNIHCPRCQSAQVYRHGQNPKGHDRFRCRDCHRVFQLTYTYEARKPGIKELITPKRITSSPVAHADVALIWVMPLIS